jgi:hypothetical protein
MNRAEDHALGVELQLIELVEQQTRARMQHREADVATVQREIDDLQAELAGLGEAQLNEPDRPAFHHVVPAGGTGPLSDGA